MDSQTYTELDSRISAVELRTSDSKDVSVYTELTALASQVHQIYRDHPQLQSLYDIITKLDIWGRVHGSSETPSHNLGDADEQHLKMVSVKYPAAMSAVNLLAELSTMDIEKIINCVAVAQTTTTNLNDVTRAALARQHLAQQTADLFHQVVLKSIIALERYTAVINDENRFWVHVEQRLSDLGQQIDTHHRTATLYNKY